jgi:hypoxanthine phosphoribosyltransferase
VQPQPNPNPPKGFAHPAEAKFARLLDFYRIPWEHEPTTFPLSFDNEGNINEALTPDFYLPNQDLYIELTTKLQSQITEKNRKIRLLKQYYPHINIKLLNRKDMRILLIKYGFDAVTGRLIGKPRDVDISK